MNEPIRVINRTSIIYKLNGQLHRTNGPAIEWTDGSKAWYINGKRHRTDGPAMEWSSGAKFWWINGDLVTNENYQQFQSEYPELVDQFLNNL